MNHTRFKEIYSRQTPQARKVYDAMTPALALTPTQVIARMSDGTYSLSIVHGCLSSLKDSGLVKEHSPGVYHRIEAPAPKQRVVRTPNQHVKGEDVVKLEDADHSVVKEKTLLDHIADFAADMRTLSERAEDLALMVEEQLQSHSDEMDKMKQLKALLKSIGE